MITTMSERIKTIDQVRPSDFDGTAKHIQQEMWSMAHNRIDIINAAEKFANEAGAHSAIAEVTRLLSSYFYACTFIEGLTNHPALRATDELKEIADDAANYSLPFIDLSNITYTLRHLFDFLLDVDASRRSAKESEEQLQLIQSITGAIPHKS
jgi:hypothetical protein